MGKREFWATRVRAFDPRLAILLTLLMGVLTWKVDAPGLVVYGVSLVLLLLLLAPWTSVDVRVLHSLVTFVVFWMALKLGLEIWRGGAIASAAAETAVLGARLFVLVCLGLVLTLVTSPRALGLALAWYSRPVLGKRAWEAALALSLMVHFLPMALRVAPTLRETIFRRCPELAWWRRALLIPQATLRILSQKTWDQTLAIASRRLDAPDAWTANFGWRGADAGAGLLIAGVLVSLAWR